MPQLSAPRRALGANLATEHAKMPNTTTLSSLSSWARTIKSALDAEGVDSLKLLGQAGLDPGQLSDPNARYPLSATTRLWELAIAATRDPAFGLKVSAHVQPTTFHALGYSLMASTSLKEAFERLLRYFHIVTNAGEISFEKRDHCYRFAIRQADSDSPPAMESQEAFLAVNLRLCRALSEHRFDPLQVYLRRSKPADSGLFEQVFNAPIAYGSERIAMDLDIGAVEATQPFANPELARHNDTILQKHLAQLSSDPLSQQVHNCIGELLSEGEPSQDKVAKRLNMSQRNLQRKLSEAGTSYSQILDKTRQTLAGEHIHNPEYSIGEIAFLLGFSDTSSFARACKRWTGMSPSQWRGDHKKPWNN